jgi:hypothetical protein
MKKTPGKRITLSLFPEQMRYLEQYQKEYGLSSRSAVVEAAFKALRERELEEGYRAWAEEARKNPDPLEEIGIADGLEPSDETNW